ncbi:MAG: malate synthase A [Bacillaceae bacterium]
MAINVLGAELTNEEITNKVLTEEAILFLTKLHEQFGEKRKALLQKRKERHQRFDGSEKPDFLKETAYIREGDWKIKNVPADLQDRRVEITGPVERKMIINALNSGAKVFMADFEDANAPTWDNVIKGQYNLYDAVRGTISFTNEKGKEYRLNEQVATLIVRPRGWHLEEKHFLVDEEPMSGSLFDFGLYFFHNAKALIEKGSGPYFYLPKMESHLEAKLWNEVFVYAQDYLGIPQGTIKSTVLIETILAAFEMDEILYELKDHIVGLNCGRWDYIFSYIKILKQHPEVILPDRATVTMTVPFMRTYSKLAIKTCHKRGAHAIGGMAAQIPIKNDEEANKLAFEKVRLDKEREATDGHDGTWVAHPGLVPVALNVFNEIMPQTNQVDKQLDDFNPTSEQLLEVPEGDITETGLRMNISVGIQYIASWLSGRGAAPIHNLMEDVATAEISRAQVWQWIHHPKGILKDGRKVTLELVQQLKEEELQKIKTTVGEQRFIDDRYKDATAIFDSLIIPEEFKEFLTLPGYEYLS